MAEQTAAGHADRLVAARRLDSVNKTGQVLAALEATLGTGQPLSIAALARRAGVSRRFIYDHPELRAQAERRAAETADRSAATSAASARVTLASLRADLANAKATNHRLDTELVGLRRRLGRLLGHDALANLDHTTVDVHATSGRLAELEQSLFQAGEDLAQRSDELDAARQINRELLAKLNPILIISCVHTRIDGQTRRAHLRATRIRTRPGTANRRAQDPLQKRPRQHHHHREIPPHPRRNRRHRPHRTRIDQTAQPGQITTTTTPSAAKSAEQLTRFRVVRSNGHGRLQPRICSLAGERTALLSQGARPRWLPRWLPQLQRRRSFPLGPPRAGSGSPWDCASHGASGLTGRPVWLAGRRGHDRDTAGCGSEEDAGADG